VSRTRQVVWASALSGASVFISMAATLVLFKLATKSLPVEDFAVFLLIQAWADALNIFTTFGLGVSLPRIIAATPEAARARQVGVALTGAAIVSLTIAMALLALWCFAAGTFSAGASRFLHYAWLVPPLYFAGALRDIALAGLAGLHRFAHRAASIVVASLLIIALASAGAYTRARPRSPPSRARSPWATGST
jgi:O-antigen/teichoic acid export membrane protein